MGKFRKTIHFIIFIKLFFINYLYLVAEDEEDCCKSLCPCFYKSEISKSNINNEEENSNIEKKKEEKSEEEKSEENEESNKEEYSYECINAVYLSVNISVGTEDARINIWLKNNGTKTWANDTKLINDSSSVLQADEILLTQQKPNEERDYTAVIKNLGGYAEGEYKAIFCFFSKGEIRGEKITAIVKIEKKDNEESEMEENMDKIMGFRDEYGLLEDEYSNEKIFEILKDNDFNFENAFSSLLKKN